jgi:hypothetical protein
VTTSSFLNEILQRNRTPNRSFRFGAFSFILDRTVVSFIDYKVVHDGTAFLISIHLFNTDTRKPCGRNSALNFVNCIWDNCSILPYRKYSIVILETEFLKQAKIYYLKHYRAESDGWTSQLFCDSCISVSKRSLQEYTFGCTISNTCKCNLCICQPPTLISLASIQSSMLLRS